MTVICPNCGYNVDREQPISDGPFTYDPRVPAFMVSGQPLRCAPQIREMLGGLMQAKGRTLSHDAVAARLGYDGEQPRNLINVLVYRARRLVEAAQQPFPVERVHSSGLRWALV